MHPKIPVATPPAHNDTRAEKEAKGIQRATYRCHWAKVFEKATFQRLKLLHPHYYYNKSKFYSISKFFFILSGKYFLSSFCIQLETYNGDIYSNSALCCFKRKLKSVELAELAFYKILCWTQFTLKVVFRSKCTCFTPCTTYHSAPDWNPIQAWYRQTAWGPWKLGKPFLRGRITFLWK